MAGSLRLKSKYDLWADPNFHKEYEVNCIRAVEHGLHQYFTFYKRMASAGHACSDAVAKPEVSVVATR